MALKALTFAAAGVDVSAGTNFRRVDCEYDDSIDSQFGAQALVAYMLSTASSGSCTIQAALCEVDSAGALVSVIARFTGTATIGADRAALGGASGSYLAPVLWSESSNRFLDLGGAGYTAGRKPTQGTGYEWRIGLSAVTTAAATTWTLLYDTLKRI